MTTTHKAGGSLKKIINGDPTIQDLYNRINQSIGNDKNIKPINEADILGLLVWPFTGIVAPAIYESNDKLSGTGGLIRSLIIHFSNPENLNSLPEEVRDEAMVILYYLNETMSKIMNNDILFHYANLYHLNSIRDQPISKGEEMKRELISWYGPIK